MSCICLGSASFHTYAAGSNKGGTKYATINGVNFTMQNSLYTGREGSDNHKFARASTSVSANQNIAGGYMGTKPVLFYSTGLIAANGTWDYTSGYSSGLSTNVTKAYFTDSPTFYSHGYVEIFDGDDYQQFQSYKTANLNNYT